MSLLSIRKVTKRFGGLVAVNELDLNIEAKSISSVIGPNGAGKSTLFNCITGFYTPEEGEIVLDDEPIQGLPPDRIAHRGISRTYQNIRLFNNMTAFENVLVGMHIRLKTGILGAILRTPGVRQEEKMAEEDARRLINFVGLEGRGDHLARNLSYGDQRRLEIARALASEPKILFLDEPTAGMNPRETEALTEFMRKLRDELGVTVVLIEHDMRVVMGISEYVAVLDYGKKIAEGTPAEVQNNPNVIEAYLGKGGAEKAAAPADESQQDTPIQDISGPPPA